MYNKRRVSGAQLDGSVRPYSAARGSRLITFKNVRERGCFRYLERRARVSPEWRALIGGSNIQRSDTPLTKLKVDGDV